MIKYFCDLCGREMKKFPTHEERANSDPTIHSIVTIPEWQDTMIGLGYFKPIEKEVCDGCRWELDQYLRKINQDFHNRFPGFNK